MRFSGVGRVSGKVSPYVLSRLSSLLPEDPLFFSLPLALPCRHHVN
jgi:hypothetical protein